VAPLTGLPQPNKAQLNAPAVVVKIDNLDAARPQTGLNQADIVYEEMVEGGLTRLAAIFQSQYPAVVGPVRSGRLTDEGIADDLNHPVFAYSGTNGVFLPILRAQPFTDVDDSNWPSEFYRVAYKVAPHNLFTNAAALAQRSTTHTGPHPLFTYRSNSTPFTGAGITPAAGITINFPAALIQWTYSPATHLWLRDQNSTLDVDSTGAQLSAANVVVEFIPYSSSLEESGEGTADVPIPTGNMVGAGTAWYFSAGHLVKGTWSRSSLTTVTTWKDGAGHTVALTAGRTWVELVPVGTTPTVAP
jgi:hypothetical protein